MTLLANYEKTCSVSSDDGTHLSIGSALYPEESSPEELLNYSQVETKERSPVLVYNGKILDINSDLINQSLSGISLKHYDGNCLAPEQESYEKNILFAEDDFFNFGESASYPEGDLTEKSKSTSSMIKLCYSPKKDVSYTAAPGTGTDSEELPSCVLDKLHSRNSFWDLHKPELCKLTWPYEYVGETIVVEHLHRHLPNHGSVCSAFHERSDLQLMLDRELDAYDKLKVLHPPTELSPDEKPFKWTGDQKARKLGPCRPVDSSPAPGFGALKDESDILPNQCLHVSKEEFCITIGKCVRKPSLRDIPAFEQGYESWMQAGEEPEYGEYFFYSPGEEESMCMVCEAEGEEEEDIIPPAPFGWIEPIAL